MSCLEGCTKPHTHKGFWCEKCHPERYGEELKKEWFENKHLLSANSTNEEIADWWLKKLAKQQEAPMGYSQWLAYGKKFGYHDYWKDMTRIALQEEFVKILDSMVIGKTVCDPNQKIGKIYNQCIADIKSKLKADKSVKAYQEDIKAGVDVGGVSPTLTQETYDSMWGKLRKADMIYSPKPTHETMHGWCCACPYDQIELNRRLEVQKAEMLSTIKGLEQEIEDMILEAKAENELQ